MRHLECIDKSFQRDHVTISFLQEKMLDVAMRFSPDAHSVAYFVAFVPAEIAWVEILQPAPLTSGADPRATSNGLYQKGLPSPRHRHSHISPTGDTSTPYREQVEGDF